MIKSKLRIAPGSYLPYLAALLVLVSAAGYLISWQITGSQYRFNTFLDTGFPPLGIAGWMQFGAMALLALLMLFAAKRSLPLLAIPALLYSVGTLLLTLDGSEKNYPLLVIGLIFFWFFVVTAFSVFHSKWPLCIVEGLALAAVAVFCIMGETPFVKQDVVMGKCYDLSLLMQVCGYYGGMLVLSLAISKKFNMETITATTRRDAPEEAAANVSEAAEEPEGEPVPEIVETVRETVPEQETSNASEPVPTVPVSGSRLQKILKEDTVYDRDQRLMYKKKINIFSVLGLILSALTVLLGVIITFELVNTPVLKNDAIGLPMLALGLFMACIFGTRVTYKEYYTKTVVTERKVVREESNWEEVLASRLEEDEQSIAVLTENYTRMTELYGKLLENTSELMRHIDRISALQSNPELETAAEETPEDVWEPEPTEVPEEAQETVWEPEPAEEPVEAQPEASVQDFSDFEDQVVFDPEFLKEQGLSEAFAEEEFVSERPEAGSEPYEAAEAVPESYEAAEAVPEPEDDAPEFILPTFRGFFCEEETPETEVELSETPTEESVAEETSAEETPTEEAAAAGEPEVPVTAEEVAESDAPVSQAEERRRRLQEKLQEIYRRNQELQKAEAERPEEWQEF